MEIAHLKYKVAQCPDELYLRGYDGEDLTAAISAIDDKHIDNNLLESIDTSISTVALGVSVDNWLKTDFDNWTRALGGGLSLSEASKICLGLSVADPTIDDVEKAYRSRLKFYSSQFRLCVFRDLIGITGLSITDEQKERRVLFDGILERLFTCRNYLLQRSRMMELQSSSGVSRPSWFTWENCSMRQWPDAETRVDKSLVLLNFLLRRAATMHLKRIGYDLYCERRIGYVPFDEDKACEMDVPPKTLGTVSYELFCSVEEFPGKVVDELLDNDAWEIMVTSNIAVQNAIRTLKLYRPAILPDLVRRRYLHSCKTGVFDVLTLEFKHFVQDAKEIGVLEDVACKFHDCHFWSDTYNQLRSQREVDELWFLKIPTPPLDHILKTQGFMEDDQRVQLWIVGMIGRLLFPARIWDNWQTVLWFYGKSRTGKSTLVEMVQNFFEVSDNVIFDAKEEEKFGLVKFFYEDTREMKFLYSGSEMGKTGVPIPRETFLKLAANERLSINKKNHNGGWVSQFDIHGVFASNELPGCGEKVPSDATLRRIFMVHFEKAVSDDQSKSMKKEFDQFMIMIIAKCAHAYHYISHYRPAPGSVAIGELSYRSWLPPKISAWQELLKKTGSFCNFLELIWTGDSNGSLFPKKFCFWKCMQRGDKVDLLRPAFLPLQIRVVETGGARRSKVSYEVSGSSVSPYTVKDNVIQKCINDMSVSGDAFMNEYRAWCDEVGSDIEKVPFQNERYFSLFKKWGIRYEIVDGTTKVVGLMYNAL